MLGREATCDYGGCAFGFIASDHVGTVELPLTLLLLYLYFVAEPHLVLSLDFNLHLLQTAHRLCLHVGLEHCTFAETIFCDQEEITLAFVADQA